MRNAVEFSRRARIKRTEISTQRRYESTSHPGWALIHVRGVYGSYFLTVRKLPTGEYIAGRFRKRKPAELACGGVQ